VKDVTSYSIDENKLFDLRDHISLPVSVPVATIARFEWTNQ